MSDIKNLNNSTMKQRIMSGLFWKFGERITAQFVSLVVSIILARLLTPSDYGAVALVMVFITLANVFVASGFGTALIQKKNADELDFSSVFYINIGLSVLIYMIIFFVAPIIARFYDMPIMTAALRVLGIRIIFAAVNTIQQAYVSRRMLFRKFFFSTLFGTIVSGIVGIIMAYLGFGVWALIAQYLINTSTDTIVLWMTVKWRPQRVFSWERAKSLISYGWKMLLSSLLDTGYTQLRSLIIGKVYSAEDLAYYNQGDRYSSFIIKNVNTSIGAVLLPAMATRQDDREKIKDMTRKSIRVSSFVIWPVMIGVFVIADPLVKVLLTEKWGFCVPYLQILCLAYGFWPIHTSNLQAINALGRSDIFLKLEIIKKVISLIIILISMRFGTLAIAYGALIDSVIGTLVNSFPNISLINYKYMEQVKDILIPICFSALMGIVIYPIKNLLTNDFLTIILQIFAGIVIYVFLLVFTKQEIVSLVSNYIKKG